MKLPLSTLTGIAAILIFYLSAACSLFTYDGSFSIFDNWISDLGRPEINPAGGLFYNIGLLITGPTLIAFYYGLYVWRSEDKFRNGLLDAGRFSGALGGLFLGLSGSITAALQPYHILLSALFFLGTLISAVLFNAALAGRKEYTDTTLGMGFALTGLLLLLGFSRGIGIEPIVVQWFCILIMAVWLLSMAMDSYAAYRSHNRMVDQDLLTASPDLR